MQYKFLQYAVDGHPVGAILLPDNTVVDAQAVLESDRPLTIDDLLEDWESVGPKIRARLATDADSLARRPLDSLELVAPLSRPGQIYVGGSNYSDHMDEMVKRDRAAGLNRQETHLTRPFHSLKASRASVVGDKARVKIPRGSKKFDWEAELAVIIGRRAEDVPADKALDYVAGFTIANDLSARDLSRREDAQPGTPFFIDWIGHKSFAGACPLGPWITPTEFVGDLKNMPILLSVNGEIRQNSSTSFMIYSVQEQIAQLSSMLPLFPGDIILTGTPGGTGTAHGRYLDRGDQINIKIGQLGELVTYVV